MKLSRLTICLLLIFPLTACSSSTTSDIIPAETTQNSQSYADSIKSQIEQFERYLALDLDRSRYTSVTNSLPYFLPAEPTLSFDSNWNKLEISLSISLDENREWDKGQKTAIPVQDNGVLPQLTGWKEVCVKNTMRDFLDSVIQTMELAEVPLPKTSMKLQLNFYIDYLLKKGKENKFGNIEGEVFEERETTLMIHLSRAYLEQVNPAEANDIFSLSDVEEPIRPPSRWNSCREYFLN